MIWSAKSETASVVVSTEAPALDEMTPNCVSIFTSFATSPLDVSEISPHSTAASTRALIWSSPSCTPSVSKAYLKSVSVKPSSFRESAFFFISFPNFEVSFPDKASLNWFAAIAVSFNWSLTSENWSANWDISEFFNKDCIAVSTVSNSPAACVILSESRSVSASL